MSRSSATSKTLNETCDKRFGARLAGAFWSRKCSQATEELLRLRQLAGRGIGRPRRGVAQHLQARAEEGAKVDSRRGDQ